MAPLIVRSKSEEVLHLVFQSPRLISGHSDTSKYSHFFFLLFSRQYQQNIIIPTKLPTLNRVSSSPPIEIEIDMAGGVALTSQPRPVPPDSACDAKLCGLRARDRMSKQRAPSAAREQNAFPIQAVLQPMS
jgi:hypothetical protein